MAAGLHAAAAPRPLPQGWWQGFHDADIDRLVPAVLRAAAPFSSNAPWASQLVALLIGLREYATALERLDDRVRAAHDALALELERLQRSERHFQARHALDASGKGAPPPADAQALERYAQLLARADAVVSAKVRLALAWVRVHQALGAS